MRYLPEIARIVSSLRERSTPVVSGHLNETAEELSAKFYSGLKSGRYKDDGIAAKELYDCSPLDTKYTTLKSRVKRRLLNSIFHLDLKKAKYSEWAQALYKANRNVFLVQVLAALGARLSAMSIARNTIKLVELYEFTPLSYGLLQELSIDASMKGDLLKQRELASKLKQVVSDLNAECISTDRYGELRALLTNNASPGEQVIELAKAYRLELEALRATCDTFTFMLNYLRLRYITHELVHEYLSMVEVCELAEQYYQTKPQFYSTVRLAEFTVRKLSGYLYLRDHEGGKRAAESCAKLIPVGNRNWFFFMETYFQLTMRTVHLGEAKAIYTEVTSHPNFGTLPEFFQEKWKIYDLYLQFALEPLSGSDLLPVHIKPEDSLRAIQRLAPTVLKDKHGLNIAVLVIHILYLLEIKDFDGIVDRIEALKVYRSRYLKPNSNPQSALFFKLLTIMENNSFSYKLTKAKAEKTYQKLLETAADPEEINEGLQILPYDWLWLRVLDTLKRFEEEYSRPRSAELSR